MTGPLPGDQVHPAVSFTTNGGFVVWEDNWIDGKGLGIGAMHLKSDLTGSGVPFRVDALTSGDQEAGQVSVLNNGGAAFAWQSGPRGHQHIFSRFLSSSNTWIAGESMVNSAANKFQTTPVVATLLNGNVAIAYASINQVTNGSMADIYLQMFAPDGSRIGGETLVNQFTANNQRTPAITALADGKVAIAWVSEQQRWTDVNSGIPSVDIMARIYDSAGNALGNEFLVNVSSNICAAPDLTAAPDGGFMAAWMERDGAVRNNGWDISARRFSSAWVGGNEIRVNTQLYGDQYSPKIRRSGTTYLAVWTSMGQDGSREGVFGRYLNDDASVNGEEFQVNSTTFGSQMHQALGTDAAGRFLTVWTSFNPGPTGFNLYAQKYVDPSVAVAGTDDPAFNTDPNSNPNSVDAVAVSAPTLPSTVPTNPIRTAGGVTNSFNDVKGTYNGLVYVADNVTPESSGYITITTTAKGFQGGFSAKLELGGQKYAFSGPFDASGNYSKTVNGLAINLTVDLHGGDRITGTISNGTWTASVLANRLVNKKNNQTPLAGNYTMVMQPIDSSMGNGIGTVSVSSLGNVKWSLTLADGTKIGQSTTLGKDGSWPLYAQPYSNGGVAIGWMTFASPTNGANGFNGQCLWIKPAGSAVYPSGLTNSLNIIGSPYKAPLKGFQPFGNSTVVLSGGGFSTPSTNSVTWNSKVPSSSPPLKLTLNPATGLIQGTLTTGPGKTDVVPFQAVLFEKDNVGLGFFVGSGQSGTVTFGPNN